MGTCLIILRNEMGPDSPAFQSRLALLMALGIQPAFCAMSAVEYGSLGDSFSTTGVRQLEIPNFASDGLSLKLLKLGEVDDRQSGRILCTAYSSAEKLVHSCSIQQCHPSPNNDTKFVL